MASKAHHNIGGLDQLEMLLKLIEDPDKYKKAVDTIKREQKKAASIVELVGTAKEIQALRSEALRNKDVTAKLLDTAKVKIEEQRQEASVQISKDRDDAADRMEKVTTKEKEWASNFKKTRSGLEAREKSLKAREDQANILLKEARTLHATGKKLREEFEGRLQKLKEI